MSFDRLHQFSFAVVAVATLGVAAHADTSFETAFADLLDKAQLDQAADLASAQLAARPGDRQAAFALGAAQFLSAVEGLGQGFYQHGLTQQPNVSHYGLPAITDLPFLRLPVPENPAPLPFTAAVLRQILTDFDTRLGAAEATLAQVPEGPVELPLDAGRIRLDMNGDGQAQETESLVAVLVAISRVSSEGPGLEVVFDESDVPWLRGYSHLLQGITEILLAHDWTEAVEQTFQTAFPQSPLAAAPLNEMLLPMIAGLAQVPPYSCEIPEIGYDTKMTPENRAIWDRFNDCSSQHRKAVEAYSGPVEDAGFGDLVAFVHLWHWQVVEPTRLLSARQHFLAMIRLSRENWALIRAETDDNREWVPSPSQTSLFPDLPVSDEIVTGWTEFLDQAEGVLEGRLLIPHWRFGPTQGLNIRRMFEEPRPLDPILLITGSGAIPYIEEGELAPGSTMNTGMALIGGGLLAYMLWFN